ncbi:Ionotropic receptor, partial [Operophtera brumata]
AGPNGTLIGLGVAFSLVKILQKRFNFTYDVVVPNKNFLGGGSTPEDSLIGLINATRILFATWWIFIILLSAFYTANLTAFLTLSKFTLDIEDPEDLYKKNYRWMSPEGGSVQYTVQSFKNYGSDRDYLPFVEGGGVLVKESISIDHLMYSDYVNKAKEGVLEADRCTYVMAPKPFMTKQRAFAYPHGSYLKELFDTVLIHILQAGIIEFLKLRDLPSTKICPLDLQSKDRQLRNSDLLMTYLIILVGLAAATAVFIGEVAFKRYICKTKSEEQPVHKKGKFRRSRKGRRDGSKPPPYDSLFGNPKYNIDATSKSKIINGREYYVYTASNGDTRLIPVRTPSAFLYR